MTLRERRYRVRSLTGILLVVGLLLPAWLSAGAQDATQADVQTVELQLTLDRDVDAGREWEDAAGRHIRDRHTAGSIAGHVTGSAEFVEDIFHAGPCDAEGCAGRVDRIGELTLTTEAERWNGTLSLSAIDSEVIGALGILIERRSGATRALLIDTAELSDGVIHLQGRELSLSGPAAGISYVQSMCLTGPDTAHGGFLASSPVDDAGPTRIRFEPLGRDGSLGMRGNGRHVGRLGLFHTEYVSTRSGDFLFGAFVMAGASGAYRDLAGFGSVRATIAGEPRCDSGRQITAHWLGVVQITFDPSRVLPPQVRIVTPENRAVLGNPIRVEADVWNIELEPAGEARDGYGHLHLIIDAPCVAPGEPIPNDEQHIHLDDGETSHEVNLPSGHHTLCMQIGDGAHVATAATDTIRIFVQPEQGEGGNFGN